ncbi:MAG: ABC transporter permease, partial [Clostridia bacterium]|nr:ABC transporter permease [Clostridia bacterium]
MYIIKNAFKSIGRSKGRNVLIGIIALVIAVSACIGLSIRQASENAREKALSGMSVTGTISYDRGAMMENIGKDMAPPEQGGGFDKDRFSDMMSSASSLSLEEYQKYSQASTVDDFYYTLTSYFDGSEKLSPVSDETSDEGNENSEGFSAPGMPGGFGGSMGGRMFSTGDFTVIGYSSDSSMTEFVNGSATILDGGTMFEEGTEDLTCVISEELSIYNNLSVGDTIVITNPSLESETYSLKISGIYTSTETNDTEMSMFGPGQDPANRI